MPNLIQSPYINFKRPGVLPKNPVLDFNNELTEGISLSILNMEGQSKDLSEVCPFVSIDNSSGHISEEYEHEIAVNTLEFSGGSSNDRVNLGSITPSHPLKRPVNSRMTVSALVRHAGDSATGSIYPRLIDISNGGNAANGWALWLFENDNTLRFGIDGNTGVKSSNNILSGSGEYAHIGLSVRSGSDIEFYKNGGSFGTFGLLPTFDTGTTINGAVGNWNHSTNRMWAGLLPIINVWMDRGFSDEEMNFLQDEVTQFEIYKEKIQRTYFIPEVGGVTNTVLVVGDLTHQNNLDSLTLTQDHTISANDSTHSNTLDNVVLSASVELAVSELLHSNQLGSVAITQAHQLSVNDLAHGNVLDNIQLAQNNLLSVDDATHSQLLDAVQLSQLHQLSVDDIDHAHNIENIALTQAHLLIVQSLDHSNTLDSVTLNNDTALAPSDLLHGHSVDVLTITQSHVLTAQGLLHNNSLDSPALTQAQILAVQELTHTNALDNLDLITELLLSVQGVDHANTLDSVSLTESNILVLDGLLHGNTLDNVSIEQAHALSVDGLIHLNALDSLFLVLPSGTNENRILEITGDNRTLTVTGDDRLIVISSRNRNCDI